MANFGCEAPARDSLEISDRIILAIPFIGPTIVSESRQSVHGRRVPQRRNDRLTKLDNYWQPIRAKAGLEDVRLHDLRHSYASRALALGESLPAIGKLLGHRMVSTTARYVHLMHDAAKAAAGRVGDSIGAHLETRRAEAAPH